ncbi:MAG: LamG domain-containing protein [Pirellulaceae bacterium]|jgi:hypothetical protein|nr:LamG domain-containing protein [Pirellulaceae bacterium]
MMITQAACTWIILNLSHLMAVAEFSPPRAGLLVWFDAADTATLDVADGRVSCWRSKDGTAPVSLLAEGRQRPSLRTENGLRPALLFDGVNDVLRCAELSRQTPTWTLVAVVAPDVPIAGGGICSATPPEGHDYDPGFTVDLYGSTTSFNQLSVEGAGRVGGQVDQMQSDLPAGGMHVLVVVRDVDQVRLYVDGKLEGQRPVTAAATRIDQLRVGARYFAGMERQYFHGAIATLLLYERPLGDDERQAIEAGLRVDEPERRAGQQRASRLAEQRRRDRMRPPRVVQSWPTVAAFLADRSPPIALETLPLRTDLREAIDLSMTHLNSLFDADRDDEPYFFVNAMADGTGKMFHSVNIGIPHVVGRSLLGTMIGEMATGIPFPEHGLAIYERYLRRSFDNPDHLNSYDDPEQGGKRCVEFHNMREGLYGLWALIAGRDSQWARDTAHAMLVTLDGLTDSEGRWSARLAGERGMADRCYGLAVSNSARMVDPLLAYHACTNDPLAMKLASLYARQGLSTLFTPEGKFAPMEQSSGHVHSITSSLSGITAYAVDAGDAELLAQCRRIVDVGVPEYFSSWGWGDEVYPEHPADVVSRGEINQTGDVVRTAVLLGAAGYPDYYDLAERYVRSMLLPTQHRLPELREFLRDHDAPADDSQRDTVRRSIGGYAMQLPNDRMREGDWPVSTLDITSGAVHALSECYRQRSVVEGNTCTVNLLFDYSDDRIEIRSQLPWRGDIALSVKRDLDRVRVRIPPWVDRDTLLLSMESGSAARWTPAGSYADITGLREGERVTLQFAVPARVEREIVDGTEYTTTWIGNQLIRIEPRGTVSPLPF